MTMTATGISTARRLRGCCSQRHMSPTRTVGVGTEWADKRWRPNWQRSLIFLYPIPNSPDREGVPEGRWQSRRKNPAKDGNVKVEKSDHQNRNKPGFEHQDRLAIQLFRVLDSAVMLERQFEIRRHQESNQRKDKNEFNPISHDERARSEERRVG